MIYNGPTLVETKLHIMLATLKALMLKTHDVIVKKQESYMMQDILYVYHLPTKIKQK
jgi:hypothetical protein